MQMDSSSIASKLVSIHPTELEQFMKCPWAYHHSNQPDTIQPDTSPDKLAIFQE